MYTGWTIKETVKRQLGVHGSWLSRFNDIFNSLNWTEKKKKFAEYFLKLNL